MSYKVRDKKQKIVPIKYEEHSCTDRRGTVFVIFHTTELSIYETLRNLISK